MMLMMMSARTTMQVKERKRRAKKDAAKEKVSLTVVEKIDLWNRGRNEPAESSSHSADA